MKYAKPLKELVDKSQEISILYVEDDDSLRENTKRLLSTFFSNIETAINGQEGLDKYHSGFYDMIISDLRMPIMDGIEMVQHVKKTDPDQIIIITSAHDESSYLIDLIKSGIENFILKPLDIEQFLSVLIKTVKLINLRRFEQEYTTKLEDTVKIRTEELSKANVMLEGYNANLEVKVSERTAELYQSLGELELANKKVMDSIEYAKMIQQSLLPSMEEMKQKLPNSFVIWKPRDIVGGDVFFTSFYQTGFIISLIDCTGHGVPGALMTMIASSGLRKVINDDQCYDPPKILSCLNQFVKQTLQQDTDYAQSNDGMDVAVCKIDYEKQQISFSGAGLSLIHTIGNETCIIKGDRESIGYKRSNLDYQFKEHIIDIEPQKAFYLFTDGMVDQVGGEREICFGKKRLQKILNQNLTRTFKEQKNNLVQEFETYRNQHEVRDDITVVGIGLA